VSIEPGWYRDPADPTVQRWWDGEGWAGEPLPADATPPPGPPEEKPPPVPPTAVPDGEPGPEADPPPWPSGQPQAPAPGRSPASTLRVPPGAAAPAPPPRPYGYALATLGSRLLARLVDIGILFGLCVVVNSWFAIQWVREVWPVVSEAVRTGSPVQDVAATSDRSDSLIMVMVIIVAALWFAYEVPAVANTGQTPGKRLLGIKVVRLDAPTQLAAGAGKEQPVGFARSFRRWNPIGLPVLLWLCGIGFVLQLLDALSPVFDRPLQQAVHDKYARTAVVSVHSRRSVLVPEEQPDGPADPPRS
jgi:uncharacterized RDD family membrane protein YckC